ncbi:zinc-binding dehydrogenase [Clostridia bacterium]|nr:zinc-binding dehydrogenase [Clostridia bacterium]
MKARAARLYGANDIRVEDFELPEISDKEILIKVVSNSICMSTYKAAILGKDHKRVPETISEKPIITGHEFAGEIVEIGDMWKEKYDVGEKVTIQPALYYQGTPHAPGYSYEFCGGNTTYCIIPWEFIEFGCLLKYDGESYSNASLAEPMSCIIGAYHANYHMEAYTYQHLMGIKEGGNLALLAAAGPMGLGAIDYIIHSDRRPGRVVVVDINEERLATAKKVLTVEEAAKNGVELAYINSNELDDPVAYLMDLTEGTGFDDAYVYAPVKSVIALADDILGKDGCLNFFAGPTDSKFKAEFNFYNVHYIGTHVIGTTGGSTNDMRESLNLTAKDVINPAVMITHVGGLEVVPETVLNLPKIPGGKKLIYPHIEMPLIDIRDFSDLAAEDARYKELESILDKSNRIWSLEAEKFVLENFGR